MTELDIWDLSQKSSWESIQYMNVCITENFDRVSLIKSYISGELRLRINWNGKKESETEKEIQRQI